MNDWDKNSESQTDNVPEFHSTFTLIERLFTC
ncbi:hypothetical protein T03_2988, partial [Trichinella britovi]